MWFLQVMLDPRRPRRFRDRLDIMFQAHVAALQAEVATVEHHERPTTSTGSSVLRDQVFALDHLFVSMFTTWSAGSSGWRSSSSCSASIHPALILLARLRGADRASVPSWRPKVEREAEESSRPTHPPRPPPLPRSTTARRPARRSGSTGNQPTSSSGGATRGAAGSPTVARVTLVAAPPGTPLAWAVFAARLRGRRGLGRDRARRQPGPVVLVLTAGGRLSAYVGVGGRRARLPARHLARLRPAPGLAGGLRRRAERRHRPAGARAARRRHRASRHVSFAYPGTDARRARATSTCACPPAPWSPSSARTAPASPPSSSCSPGCTPPTSGRITADGTDLAASTSTQWRAAAVRRVPGLRPPGVPGRDHRRPRRRAAADDDRAAVGAAVDRAGADDVVDRPARRPRHPARPVVGRTASTSASASGRSSRWPAATCAPSRCCWCSTSRPRRSTPRPSTPCSSATPPARREADDQRPGHGAGLPPLLDRADGRPDRRARRRPRRRGRQPRRADGAPRHLRRALLHPGRELRLSHALRDA